MPFDSDPPSQEIRITPAPLVQLASARHRHDKALVDQALVQQVIADLPSFYQALKDIALDESGDTDASTRARTILSLFDRVAGKPTESLDIRSTNLNVTMPPEEVARLLGRL
jgi:hypothetical protein